MLDINFISKNPDLVKKVVKDRQLGDSCDVDAILSLRNRYLDILRQVETKRGLKNKLSEGVSKVSGEERGKLISEASQVKQELKGLEDELTKLEKLLKEKLYEIPNLVADDVPVGIDESENKVLRKIGEPLKFTFEPLDHVDLGVKLDLIEIERAAKVSGSRFYYLKNEAVFLEFAIVQFVLNTLTDKKVIGKIAKRVGVSTKTFIPVVPPVFARTEVMSRMDRLYPVDDRYVLEKDELVLIGSAEHTLGPLHMDESLKEGDLPIRYLGFSTSFRREAGTYGKDTRGILRTHQFDKLEMESFTTAQTGEKEQEFMIAIQEYLLQELGLPYRVVILCTGDMGKPDYRQIDMEVWLPGQQKYRETHSSDYMTDFQARGLNTTYVDTKGNKAHVHMNDATAFAIGRTLIAIFENNQQKDGSIVVPKVLRKYAGFSKVEPKTT